MPVIEGLDPGLQGVLTTVFILAVAIFTAWSHVRGRAAPRQKEAEFSVASQLADMGPIKELVEQTGLLVQQQLRSNIHLEACARALTAAAEAYSGQIAAARNESEIEEEVQRRFEREMERERRAKRRALARRKSAAS